MRSVHSALATKEFKCIRGENRILNPGANLGEWLASSGGLQKMPGRRKFCFFTISYEGPWGSVVIFFFRDHCWSSFWLSWGTLGTHFGSLGTLFGLILPLLGRLGTSWDAFFAQVGARWPKRTKKTSIFEIAFRSWHQVKKPKSRKIDFKNDVFSRYIFDIEFYQFFIDLGLRKSTFLRWILELKAKTSIL